MPTVKRAEQQLRRAYSNYLAAVKIDLPLDARLQWRGANGKKPTGLQQGRVVGHADTMVRVKNDRTHSIQFIKISRVVARIGDEQ